MRKRKPRIDLHGFQNEYGTVTRTDKPMKWVLLCNMCGKEHEQSSREIQRNAAPRSCEQYKPHNWSGLDKWDGIIRRMYGITLEQYHKLVEHQGGGCAICGRSNEPDGRKLSIDHCHTSGNVRGVLCYACNKALGLFYDQTERLAKAIQYLNNPPALELAR